MLVEQGGVHIATSALANESWLVQVERGTRPILTREHLDGFCMRDFEENRVTRADSTSTPTISTRESKLRH